MKWLVLGDIGRRNIYHVGDEAMADAAIVELTVRGASQIILVATDAAAATDLYGLPAVERVGVGPSWTVADRDRMLENAATGELDETTPLGRLNAAVLGVDAVLISGGGNMTSRFGHHIDERAALCRLARRHGKPIAVAAQTIGPDLTARERKLLAEIVTHAEAFAVRDDESYHLALELGCEPDRVHRVSDDAILLAGADLDDEAVMRLALTGGRYVAASFTADTGDSGLGKHDYLDLVTNTLDQVAGDLDADVLLIPHIGALSGVVPQGDELSDASIVERSRTGRIRALRPMTARVAAAVTQRALLSVSTRYHAAVFATAQGTPALGISLSKYSTIRMRGALEPLGLGEFVLGPASWETIPAAARELAERRSELRQWLEPVLTIRRARQRDWWDCVATLASHSGLSLVPVEAEQFPVAGNWAPLASRSLELFEALEEERRRVAHLKSQWDRARRDIQRRDAVLAAQRKRLKAAEGRAERAENRRIVRVADAAGSVFRAGWRRPLQKQLVPEPSTPDSQPLLTVLIPIYNVESYLDECLQSVVTQSLEDMEILLIDDGSTDGSVSIAQRFAGQDSRIRLISQENRGLGAVRNRGVQLARGRYLTFVDSDDVLPRAALSALVESLEASGSDVSMGGTVRLLPDGSERTWQWVRDQYTVDRTTTLAESPELLRNFYTWNKAYRADFWHRHGFRFREGVLFEDQPVVTEILHEATAIDVVARTVYRYRIRPDDSALTGTMYALPDVLARHEATTLTAAALDRLDAAPAIKRAWLWTLVEHHMPRYLKFTANGPGPEYTAVVAMMREVLSIDDVRLLENVSAAHRMLCYLALAADQQTVTRYLDAGGGTTSGSRLERRDGETVAALPVEEDDPHLPLDLYVVADAERRLVAIVKDHGWREPGLLTVDARVGVSQCLPPEHLRVEPVLALADGKRIPLTQMGRLVYAPDLPRPFGVSAWYEMRIDLDAHLLVREHGELLRDGARIEVALDWDGLMRSGVLDRRADTPGARHLTGSIIPGTGMTLELRSSRVVGLELRTATRPVSATVRAAGETSLELDLRSHRHDLDVVFLTAKAPGAPARRQIVRRVAPGEYRSTIDLTWLEPGQHAHLVAVGESGARRNVHVSAAGLGDASTATLALTTTPGARLRIIRRVLKQAEPSK